MTTCLLCKSPAVADGLCVPDGARKYIATLVLKGTSPDKIRRRVGGTIELLHASAEIDTPAKANAFLARLDAAKAEREVETCGREECRECQEER